MDAPKSQEPAHFANAMYTRTTSALREMGGAPRNPAPRSHFLAQVVKPSGHRCADAFGGTKIVECRPLLGALPLSPICVPEHTPRNNSWLGWISAPQDTYRGLIVCLNANPYAQAWVRAGIGVSARSHVHVHVQIQVYTCARVQTHGCAHARACVSCACPSVGVCVCVRVRILVRSSER